MNPYDNEYTRTLARQLYREWRRRDAVAVRRAEAWYTTKAAWETIAAGLAIG